MNDECVSQKVGINPWWEVDNFGMKTCYGLQRIRGGGRHRKYHWKGKSQGFPSKFEINKISFDTRRTSRRMIPSF